MSEFRTGSYLFLGPTLCIGIPAVDLLQCDVPLAGGPGPVRAADKERRVSLELDMARMGFRDDEEMDSP